MSTLFVVIFFLGHNTMSNTKGRIARMKTLVNESRGETADDRHRTSIRNGLTLFHSGGTTTKNRINGKQMKTMVAAILSFAIYFSHFLSLVANVKSRDSTRSTFTFPTTPHFRILVVVVVCKFLPLSLWLFRCIQLGFPFVFLNNRLLCCCFCSASLVFCGKRRLLRSMKTTANSSRNNNNCTNNLRCCETSLRYVVIVYLYV